MKAKPMKRKKVMRVSKIAKGKRAKSRVFAGLKEKTVGGLKKADLTKNKSGRVVSKRRSAAAKKMHAATIGKWIAAVMKARASLNITGFCSLKKGSELYRKSRQLYDK